MTWQGNDLISTNDLSKEDILTVLEIAKDIKFADLALDESARENFQKKYGIANNALLNASSYAAIFSEASTRTYQSSIAAAGMFGAVFVGGFSSASVSSLKKGETLEDTLRIFFGYNYNGVVIRHHLDGSARWAKVVSENFHSDYKKKQELVLNSKSRITRPFIINAGDGQNQHPTQCLLDLFTILEARGRLDIDLGLANDLKYGRTTHSLISVAHHFDMRIHMASPNGFELGESYLNILKKNKVKFFIHKSLSDLLKVVDVAYLTRFQEERLRDLKEKELIGKDWQTNKELIESIRTLRKDKSYPILLHPRPVDKNMYELHPDLNSHISNYTDLQSSNGKYIRTALFALLSGKIKHLKTTHRKEIKQASPYNILYSDSEGVLSKKEKVIRSGLIEDEGLVIDHISSGKARRLVGFLGLDKNGLSYSEDAMLKSEKLGTKDIIKIHQNFDFSDIDFAKIALVAGNKSTISFIQKGKVVKKVRPILPNELYELVFCSNSYYNKDGDLRGCISSRSAKEGVPNIMIVGNSNNTTSLTCFYCEQTMSLEFALKNHLLIYPNQKLAC